MSASSLPDPLIAAAGEGGAGLLAKVTASVLVIVPSLAESSRHARPAIAVTRADDIIRARANVLIFRAR